MKLFGRKRERVELPPLDQFGPWPPQPKPEQSLYNINPSANDDHARECRTAVAIENMRLQRKRLRDIPAGSLVPDRTHRVFQDMWANEQADLREQEAERLAAEAAAAPAPFSLRRWLRSWPTSRRLFGGLRRKRASTPPTPSPQPSESPGSTRAPAERGLSEVYIR